MMLSLGAGAKWGGGGAEMCCRPGQQSPRGSQMGNKVKSLSKKNYFSHLTHFKLFAEIEVKPLHNFDLF
jgi:hypothetical protein